MANDRASSRPGGTRGADAKRAAHSAAQQLKDKGREAVESTTAAAADQAQTVAGAVESAADQLSDTNPTLAGYARGLSRNISSVADQMSNRSLEELLGDARALAARNPTLFLLGSVGVGIVLSRFLKAGAYGTDQLRS